eukprot:GHVU01198415.1.p2 GENE.GHVU01198415.1~~GHVU01198415.1.p2  ORF type:complete len:100 (-),score=26.50 GHVU01198415.1:29-328(-)
MVEWQRDGGEFSSSDIVFAHIPYYFYYRRVDKVHVVPSGLLSGRPEGSSLPQLAAADSVIMSQHSVLHGFPSNPSLQNGELSEANAEEEAPFEEIPLIR